MVEVHKEHELREVLKTKAEIIGINNRNLDDFSVDLNITKTLLPKIPKGKVVVSESGMFKKEDIPKGVQAVLIGEGLTKDSSLLN